MIRGCAAEGCGEGGAAGVGELVGVHARDESEGGAGAEDRIAFFVGEDTAFYENVAENRQLLLGDGREDLSDDRRNIPAARRRAASSLRREIVRREAGGDQTHG